MALLFMDGFDAGDIAAKWSVLGTAWSSTTSTRLGNGMATISAGSAGAMKAIAPSSQVFIGTAYKRGLSTTSGIMELYCDNGTRLHLRLNWNTNGAISLERSGGGSIASSSAGLLPVDTWGYIEWSATIADAGGTVTVKLNGADIINYTGDTRNAGTSTNIDAVVIGGNNSGYFDDLYICDGTGSAPYNTFLGDVRINTLVPDGAGASTAFTPLSGLNHEEVDELPYSDTDYVTGMTPGTYDSYTMSNLSGSYNVLGIQSNVIAKKLDAGGTSIRPIIRSGGSAYNGSSVTLSTVDRTISSVHAQDPATSSAWTISGVNNIEAGMEIV